MSRLIVLAILVASANAYQTFTGMEYSNTACTGAIKNQMTIPTGMCSYKLKVTATATGMSAQRYSDTACATTEGAAESQTTAELAGTGTCVIIDGSGWKFNTGASTNAYAVKFAWTSPTALAGSTVYLAADTCFTFETTKSAKAVSTTATATTPTIWGSSGTCLASATNSNAGVQNSPYSLSEVIGTDTFASTITIVTLDSAGGIITSAPTAAAAAGGTNAPTTALAAGGTNAPTAAATNSASQATFPLLALLSAFVVKMVHGL